MSDAHLDNLMERLDRLLVTKQVAAPAVVPVLPVLPVSPLPRPRPGFGGEPIPRPGLPPGGVPPYLKPIPFNTRDIEAVFRAHLREQEPRVMRELYSTWNAQAEPIKDQEWRNALRDGALTEARWDELRQAYAEFVNTRMAPLWERSQRVGARLLGRSMARRLGMHSDRVPFAELRDHIARWIETRGGELIVAITDAQRQAIVAAVRHYGALGEQVHVRELGRILRPLVGLTPRQALAVARYRDSLAEEGVALSQREHLVGNYLTRLRRIRAERIARTEVATAFHAGGYAQVLTTFPDPDQRRNIEKVWQTADDERVCFWCRNLDNQVVGLHETFPAVTRRVPDTLTPPAHPNCRCTLGYQVVGGLAEQVRNGTLSTPAATPTTPVSTPVPPRLRTKDVRASEVAAAVAARRAELEARFAGKTREEIDAEWVKLLDERRALHPTFKLDDHVRMEFSSTLTQAQERVYRETVESALRVYGPGAFKMPGAPPSVDDPRPVLRIEHTNRDTSFHTARNRFQHAGFSQTRIAGTISLGGDGQANAAGVFSVQARGTLFHEVGHWLENANRAHDVSARHFLVERARARDAVVRRMPWKSRGSLPEVGWDAFPDLYTGRIYVRDVAHHPNAGTRGTSARDAYRLRATEMTSMAFERAATATYNPSSRGLTLGDYSELDPEWMAYWWSTVQGDYGYQMPR